MKNGTISIGKVFRGNFEPFFIIEYCCGALKRALIIKVVYTLLFFVYVSYRIELGDISYVIYGAYHCPKVYDKYSKSVRAHFEGFFNYKRP